MRAAIDRVLARIEIIPFSGCWIFMGALNGFGYGIVGRGGRGTGTDRAHRVTYRHFKGEIPADRPVLCHRCDVPACCNPDHLFAGTLRDNARDAVEKGRASPPPRNLHLRGEAHYNAMFSREQVVAIRARLRGGERASVVARELGVNEKTLGKIKRGETWNSV